MFAQTKSYFMKKLLLPVLMIVTIANFTSCKKEGCTDLDATNYSSDAKKDDGSCVYEGRNVIWWNQSTSVGMQNYPSNTFYLYVDGVFADSKGTSTYWTSAPDCGDNGSITITKDLGGNKLNYCSYRAIDEDGYLLWEGTLTFEANTCSSVQLVW